MGLSVHVGENRFPWFMNLILLLFEWQQNKGIPAEQSHIPAHNLDQQTLV